MEEENISNLSNPAEPKYNFSYNAPKKKSNKITIFLVIMLVMIISAILIFFLRSSAPGLIPKSSPVIVYNAPSSTPSPSPASLVRSDWSFEVLNGSGTSGLAKKIALELQNLGYQVVKTGNADKQNFAKTEILVKKDFQGKIDLVIADLKDVIKIASIAGELTEGTASARIIIGKDSI